MSQFDVSLSTQSVITLSDGLLSTRRQHGISAVSMVSQPSSALCACRGNNSNNNNNNNNIYFNIAKTNRSTNNTMSYRHICQTGQLYI